MPLGSRRQSQRDPDLLFDSVEARLEVLLKEQGKAFRRKRGVRHDGAGKVALSHECCAGRDGGLHTPCECAFARQGGVGDRGSGQDVAVNESGTCGKRSIRDRDASGNWTELERTLRAGEACIRNGNPCGG